MKNFKKLVFNLSFLILRLKLVDLLLNLQNIYRLNLPIFNDLNLMKNIGKNSHLYNFNYDNLQPYLWL